MHHPVRRPRLWAALAAALALVVVAVPFLPDSAGPEPALTPSGDSTSGPSGTDPSGTGLTPEVLAEIDRVVAEGRAVGRAQGRAATARALVRCATFEGQRYCLGHGWTDAPEAELAGRLTARPTRAAERTGDLGPGALLARAIRTSPAARARAERAELTMAARSVDKVIELRKRPRRTAEDYPRKDKILTSRQVKAQNEYYWCGPATMQAIAWAWKERRHDQAYWARRLRTTTAGTGITDMVRVINNHTGFDNKKYAGPYVALDIADYSFDKWFLLMMRHIHDYDAPVVLHPVLEKRFYPYLDDDASGHFQVGRGYDKNPRGNPQIGYFEPWDQSRFDPTEPSIPRVQWRSAYKSYRANQAHFQHNVGV
ncbi:hypothetical protein EXE58_09615 [Nocardioides seonyuensis]|uniref:Peptidase C39-like domain-containing protein n=1 Tax=Nocardioides seonyuensis TaxID=2518371 RepID=A0A4P7IEL9_9ACTN|nr:C39 family peptidase [Nocardioides seonyuensis]QBX55685.1 hypothetical protein EXE58_09615 [Nocardioides seonyuensis]